MRSWVEDINVNAFIDMVAIMFFMVIHKNTHRNVKYVNVLIYIYIYRVFFWLSGHMKGWPMTNTYTMHQGRKKRFFAVFKQGWPRNVPLKWTLLTKRKLFAQNWIFFRKTHVLEFWICQDSWNMSPLQKLPHYFAFYIISIITEACPNLT